MRESRLRNLENRRVVANRRIGVYFLWIIPVGVAFALFFFGGGITAGKRWGIFAFAIVYVAVRLAIMRYRTKRREQKKSEEGASFTQQ